MTLSESGLSAGVAGRHGAGAFHPDNDDAGSAFSPYAELAQWGGILERAGVPRDRASALARHAAAAGTSLVAEAEASNAVAADRLYRELARYIGVPYLARIEPDLLVVHERDMETLAGCPAGRLALKVQQADGQVAVVVSGQRLDIRRMREAVARSPDLATRLRIAAPVTLRAAVMARASASLARLALDGLYTRYPAQSARVVANAWQGAMFGAMLVALPLGVAVAPSRAGLAFHLFSSLFFSACVLLRYAAATTAAPPRLAPLRPFRAAELPVYSVLVALNREEEIVPDLLAALDRLVWPRGRLEVKLVCEADDAPTLAALRAKPLASFFEIVEVPPGEPRTKPKALAYALPATSGAFVALYDAEDRPHPLQLLEAWSRFSEADASLACLQAPLSVTNHGRDAIARMFAFEYAALFRGLLPWLARRRLLIPLGGTSNHFRGLMYQTQ